MHKETTIQLDLDKSIREANDILNSTICTETQEDNKPPSTLELKDQSSIIKFDPLIVANDGESNYIFRNLYFSEPPYRDPIEFMKSFFLRNKKLTLQIIFFNFLFTVLSIFDGVISRLPFLWGIPVLLCTLNLIFTLYGFKFYKLAFSLLEDDCVEVVGNGDNLFPRVDDLKLYIKRVRNINAVTLFSLVAVLFDLILIFFGQIGILDKKLTAILFKEQKNNDIKEKGGMITFGIILFFNLLYIWYVLTMRLYFKMKPSCDLAVRDIETNLEKALENRSHI